jgi:PAS domain S-box-containing protein
MVRLQAQVEALQRQVAIGERSLAQEQKLRQQAEANLSNFLGQPNLSIVSFRLFEHDPHTYDYDYCSAGCHAVFGYTAAEFMADRTLWRSRIHPDDWHTIVAPSWHQLLQGVPHQREYRFRHRDGSQRWVLADLTSQWNAAERCWVVTVIDRDVSDRKQGLDILAASESQYRLLFEANPNPMWIFDLETLSFLAVNQAAANLYGYTQAELLQMTLSDMRPVNRDNTLAQSLDAIRQNPDPQYCGEWVHQHKDGSLIQVSVSSNSIVWAGKPARFTLINDVTAQKQSEARQQFAEAQRSAAERALSKREAQLHALIEYLPLEIWAKDRNGISIIQNQADREHWGRNVGAPHDKSQLPSDLWDAWKAQDAQVLAGEVVRLEESRLIHGEWRTFNKIIAPIWVDGAVDGMVGVNIDMTDYKRAKAALEESETFLRSIFEGSQAAISVIDVRDNMLCLAGLNPAQEERLGLIDASVRGKPLSAIFPPTTIYPLYQRYWGCVMERVGRIYETHQQRNGESCWWLTTLTPLLNSDGQVYRLIESSLDITPRKLAEDQLRQLNQRLEERVQQRTAALQQQAQREKLLRAIVQRIRQSLNLDDVLATAVTEVRQSLGTDRAAVLHWRDPDTWVTVKDSVMEGATSIEQASFPNNLLAQSATDVLQQGEARIVQDVAQDPWGTGLLSFMQSIGVVSKMVAPILCRDNHDGNQELWGVLVVHSSQAGRRWQAAELEVLKQIANQLAIAIQQASLYHQLQAELGERRRAESQLRSSLQEKEVLLQEVHHRVKNNLQMISSLLSLQSRTIADPQILEPFVEGQRRIQTMALIHQKLYHSGNLAEINMAHYVQSLIADLFSACRSGEVALCAEVVPVPVSLDVAIACGLIINELVSNAFKYAFPNSRQISNGRISIHFAPDATAKAPRQYTLSIADNGIGLAETVDFPHPTTLGLRIVYAMIQKLRAQYWVDRTEGSAFHISFTLD